MDKDSYIKFFPYVAYEKVLDWQEREHKKLGVFDREKDFALTIIWVRRVLKCST